MAHLCQISMWIQKQTNKKKQPTQNSTKTPTGWIQRGGGRSKSSETSHTFHFWFHSTKRDALTFRTWHYYQSSVNKNSIGEMLRHTNTGGVSVLYITHFGRERQGGIVGRVESQLLDVSQEAEQSSHLLAAHGRWEVGDLDDSSPRYPAHCGETDKYDDNCDNVDLFFSSIFI